MTTVGHPSEQNRTVKQNSLQVSTYDKARGLLLSLLLLEGLTSLTLFCLWLSTVLVFVRVSAPVKIVGAGLIDKTPQSILEPEGPSTGELQIADQPDVAAALNPVSNLASVVAASLDTSGTDSQTSMIGGGDGNGLPPDPRWPPTENDVIPPWERWEIRYESNNIEEYARQLDYFGIELAAVGGSKYADYAFNLTNDRPSTRQGSGKDEQRVYLTWKTGSRLREFDERLLQRAGIVTEGRLVMQFIPPSVAKQLEGLETENAGGIPPQQWQKTVFGIRKRGAEFEFYIQQQIFRPMRSGQEDPRFSDSIT